MVVFDSVHAFRIAAGDILYYEGDYVTVQSVEDVDDDTVNVTYLDKYDEPNAFEDSAYEIFDIYLLED